MACATTVTHCVCGEFDTESCGKLVVSKFWLEGVSVVKIVCPLVHVLPSAVHLLLEIFLTKLLFL